MLHVNGRHARRALLWIVIICIAPALAAYLTYYVFKPAGGVLNHGALIEPQRPIPPDLTLLEDQGEKSVATPLHTLRGKWLMLSVDTGACAHRCVKKLYFMRQIRAAQGQARTRILTLWIRTDPAPVPPILRQAYGDTRFLIADPHARMRLTQWLPTEAKQTYRDALYLVDPNGHLMMRFPADLAPDKIQKDLTRLLKWSGSG